jgi:hypothetical protein
MPLLKRVSLSVVDAGFRATVVTRQFGQVVDFGVFRPGPNQGFLGFTALVCFPNRVIAVVRNGKPANRWSSGAWWRPVSGASLCESCDIVSFSFFDGRFL